MVIEWCKEHMFASPWKSVTGAWFFKYPNKHSKQVSSADVIDRSMDKNTGELRIRRLITTRYNTPLWLQRIGFPTTCNVLDEVIINPMTQHMRYNSVNISGSQYIKVKETCDYKPKNNGEYTQYNQKIRVDCNQIMTLPSFLINKIESTIVNILSDASKKGIESMNELNQKWQNIGHEGLIDILKIRQQLIQMMQDLHSLQFSIDNINILLPNKHL